MPFPIWTAFPFVVLVLGIAILPLVAPNAWGKHGTQALFAFGCAAPVVVYLGLAGHTHHLSSVAQAYVSFVATIGALYITTSGIFVSGDIEATPRANTVFMLTGALLASFIGTTGASILLIRPLLRTNRQRENRSHLVPFFILAVANAGGLLTPLGDPPLLLGYLEGVPFFWTLTLFPYWLLYVGTLTSIFYLVERRMYRAEPAMALQRDRAEIAPLGVHGKRNVFLLLAIVAAVLLPAGPREACMLAIAATSFFATPRRVHEQNGFSFAPILEVGILFAGLFACLAPIEAGLARLAPSLPLQHPWQLFWASGLLSSVLDNAPTYAAFAALARGLSHGQADLVAGVAPAHLVAVSVGSVVMGATTYIGNGPNLMVRAVAERAGFVTPSFFRYAAFAIVVLVPIHIVTSIALILAAG